MRRLILLLCALWWLQETSAFQCASHIHIGNGRVAAQLGSQRGTLRMTSTILDAGSNDAAKLPSWRREVVWKVQSLRGQARQRMHSRIRSFVTKMRSLLHKGKLTISSALVLLTLVLGRAAKASAASTTPAATATMVSSTPSTPSLYTSSSRSTSTTAPLQDPKTVLVEVVVAKSAPGQRRPSSSIIASASAHAGKTVTSDHKAQISSTHQSEVSTWNLGKEDVEIEVGRTFENLFTSLQGAKLDTLILLIVTSAVIPIFKAYNVSSILGFLFFGTVLGPNGLHWLKDVHMIDMLGELGIVFFLFEIGLELSLERLMSMKKDVFGLGTSQFLLTSALGTLIGTLCGLPTAAAVTIGGSLSLSSSAFVLQLLKDKKAMGSRVGRASFGILLLQDLAVVPLLVIVELLAKGGSGLGKALTIAFVKALVALTTMSFAGRMVLGRIFFQVAKSGSQEAFLSIILSTVLLMSFVTQGIGLSNTLGAFLAGLLLAETKYRYQVESDIAPFRGILLGFFFITVGFSIDPRLLLTSAPQILLLLTALLASKAAIITGLSMANGMSFSDAQQTGILNAQGGEFAFVAFAIAEKAQLLSPRLNKVLLTTVALSMALTPALAELGAAISAQLDEKKGLGGCYFSIRFYSLYMAISIFSLIPHQILFLTPNTDVSRLLGQDDESSKLREEMVSKNNFVLVCGYGRVGKMVCDMLDKQLIPYIAIDSRPQKAMDARAKGLPVFFGDINRPEVLKNFHLDSAKACVITVDDLSAINKAVVSVRKMYPALPIVARAANQQHQKRLEGTFDNVYAMCPMLPEDSVLLTLPFGGAVLQQVGVSKPEIDAILDEFRDMYMEDTTEESIDFFTSFQKRLPPSNSEEVAEAEGVVESEDLVIDPVAEDSVSVLVDSAVGGDIAESSDGKSVE